MTKKLRCHVGAHRWRIVQKDPPYKKCQDCEATQDIVVATLGAGEDAAIAQQFQRRL